MADVLEFPQADLVNWGKALRNVREEFHLTLAQAAAALEISPITLDTWEQGRKPQLPVETVESRYRLYRKNTNNCRKTGNNLIFGIFPIRIAREILGYTVKEMASEFRYSESSWTKMEANARLVPAEKINEIEGRVSAVWDSVCSSPEQQ